MNILTFDIEEWFHFDVYSGEQKWMDYEPRINLFLPQILDLLDQKQIKATFFCLGWIARTYPSILKTISDRGHEIACHTDKHLFVKDMTSEEFDNDLTLALKSIEDVVSTKVESFRAPSFTITEDTPWAFEVLDSHGIKNDCSVFPATRSYGGFPSYGEDKPSLIKYNNSLIKELPMNTMKICRKDIVYSGGGYFRLFPYWLIKKQMQKDDYVMTYLHMRDFDYEQPRFNHFSFERKFKSYYGLKNSYSKFIKMINDFEWVNVNQAVGLIDWDNVPVINLSRTNE